MVGRAMISCPCGASFSATVNREVHNKGRRHAGWLATQAQRPSDAANHSPPAFFGGSSTHGELPPDPRSDGNNARQRAAKVRTTLTQSEEDQCGVTISHREDGVDFGVVEVDEALGSSTRHTLHLTVARTSEQARICLKTLRFASSASKMDRTAHFAASVLGSKSWLNKGRQVAVVFQPSYEGSYEDILELEFVNAHVGRTFTITRRVRGAVGNVADFERLRPSAPYVKPPSKPRPKPEGRIIPPPPTWTETKWCNILPQFPVPAKLVEVAFAHNKKNVARDVRSQFLPGSLGLRTYAAWFNTLLYIEEEQNKIDLDKYSMFDVRLNPNNPNYWLEVAGLAEKRPSVLVGDYIRVKHSDTLDDVWYQGRVHKAEMTQVHIRFSDTFSTYKGRQFDVRFVLNRLPLRRAHQAVSIAPWPPRLLFPTSRDAAMQMPASEDQTKEIVLFNRLLEDDHEQLQAVATILHSPPGSAPFILFGPPGTGKTVTVVESILQLLHADPERRVLVCAPSNSAADLLAMRLQSLGSGQLFRLNALSRLHTDLPKDLRPFSCINGNLIFAIPPVEELRKFRCIVSTCTSAAIPFGLGLPRGHFSHVFVDEAGQCTEPDLMIAAKLMVDDKMNVVVAGDNKQLGPVIRSELAARLGLSRSYLSRLMDSPVYDLNLWRGRTIVKLIKNWRSHPVILSFANDQFYSSELRACADPAITHSLLRSDVLVKPGFPIVFHGVAGGDMREKDSPSFFNIGEASLVRKYCQDLMDDRRLRLKPEHIGVISPYHAQCMKIRSLLPDTFRSIKVGSVEEFQGQERRIIILSTVRSSHNYVEYDLRHTLGFVANARRFNVAITRAQALLIVIGDPAVLSLDPIWRRFLNYVYTNGGCRGKLPDWDTDLAVTEERYDRQRQEQALNEADEMIQRLKAHIFDATESWALGEDDDSDDGEYYLDKPWREDD